jgi:hypothetical protein
MPHGSRISKPGLWIFILGCLLSAARLIVNTPSLRQDQEEAAQRMGHRFDSLRTVLPQRGVIGYIGQKEDGVKQYYLAQYALAPLVIDHSPNHPIVIGNFPTSTPTELPDNLQLVHDFGGGVLLFASKDTR